MKPVVAIDGPAGSGKGTLARMIASHFNFVYLDTGLLYRTVAFLNVPLVKIKTTGIKELMDIASTLTNKQLRSAENSARASNIAKMPEIRDIMTHLQQNFIDLYKKQGTVLDGRDIGTVVAPDACCKLFITADLKERARRRFADLKDKNTTFDEIFNNIKLRDIQDKSRKIAPLTCDETYIMIDTTDLSVQESFKICREEVKKAFMNSEFRSFV